MKRHNELKENGTNRFEYLITTLVALISSVLIGTRCSLNPFYPTRPFTDSSVYLYIANVMQRGGMMYRDSFDHKGPLLYIINYLGSLFGTESGVWIFEIAAIFFAIVFTYFIIRRFCPPAVSVIGSVCPFLLLNDCFYGGNNPEEYALPFSVCSMLIFVDYFQENETTWRRVLICGLCCMAVMLIRPNMIAVWIVFCVMVIVKEIKQKTFRIVYYVLWFVFGALIFLVPFILFLHLSGALKDCWEQFFLFNIRYSGTEQGNALTVLQIYIREWPVLLSIVISLITLIFDKENRVLSVICFGLIVVTILLAAMSGRGYLHYEISFMPMFILPVAFLLHRVCRLVSKQYIVIPVSLCIMGLLLFPWVQYILQLPYFRPANLSAERYLSAIINENTEQDDRIISCGNADLFYVYSDRMAASKYSYQLPIAEVNPDIYELFMEDINKVKPEAIVLSDDSVNGILYLDRINQLMKEYIDRNGYYEWENAEGFYVYGKHPMKGEKK